MEDWRIKSSPDYFDINKPQTIIATCAPQRSIINFFFNVYMPGDTEIRFLFSIDKVNWKKYNGALWEDSSLEEIATAGMSLSEARAMPTSACSIFNGIPFYVAASLKTTNSKISPLVHSVTAIVNTDI